MNKKTDPRASAGVVRDRKRSGLPPWRGTQPVKTKGIKRQLAKVKKQNPAEYDRQMSIIGG
jgi:hypothetical protein